MQNKYVTIYFIRIHKKKKSEKGRWLRYTPPMSSADAFASPSVLPLISLLLVTLVQKRRLDFRV